MRLFIAEKPSMGREISKYLPGAPQRKNGYILHGDDVVTWAFGHVLQQAEPGDYEARYLKWNAADLPIIPGEWKLLVSKSSEAQFHIIKRLIDEADIIVNAGDPDREGQLLIDEILLYVDNQKPVQRILLNALDEKSVKAALANLRDNKDFYNLQQSALARSRADWLIGMNLSRAYTLAAQRQGYKVTLPIGRVKTPTLSLVVRRERELADFKPVEYFTIKGEYEHPLGTFSATWQPSDVQKGVDSEGRLLEEDVARYIIAKLMAQPAGIIKDREKSKKKELQRLPLSLSSLQVSAGKSYGYDPQRVLDIAQKLYEKKLTSYPRSDCDYLPENQFEDSRTILANLSNSEDMRLVQWVSASDASIKSRAWNDKKITAHHAIIPTTVPCKVQSLNKEEQDIYRLIAQAYIAQFYPVHEYEQAKITVLHEEEVFIARGRVITVMGWKELYRRPDSEQNKKDDVRTLSSEEGDDSKEEGIGEGKDLPAVKKGDQVKGLEYRVEKKITKPPSRFTPATLLQAMKEIHKYVKNDDLKRQLKEVAGIGTEATRATIIDELIQRKFLREEGKKKILYPTDTAYLLVDALPDEMTYPDETAIWEARLSRMSEGKDNLESFLADQETFLRELIRKADVASGKATERKPCPSCEKGYMVKREGKFGTFYGCSSYPACKHTEQAKQSEQSSGPPEKTEYKCPRCETGYFVKMEQGERIFWRCNNIGICKTSCSDVGGRPSIFAKE